MFWDGVCSVFIYSIDWFELGRFLAAVFIAGCVFFVWTFIVYNVFIFRN